MILDAAFVESHPHSLFVPSKQSFDGLDRRHTSHLQWSPQLHVMKSEVLTFSLGQPALGSRGTRP